MRYQDGWLTDEIPGRHRMTSKWGYTSLTDEIWLTDEIPGSHRMTSKWRHTSLTDEMPNSRIDTLTHGTHNTYDKYTKQAQHTHTRMDEKIYQVCEIMCETARVRD